MDLVAGELYWPQTPAERCTYPPLSLDEHCEAAVIGGGVTGAPSAYELARLGINVVLVDKKEICSGSSSASTRRYSPQGTKSSAAGGKGMNGMRKAGLIILVTLLTAAGTAGARADTASASAYTDMSAKVKAPAALPVDKIASLHLDMTPAGSERALLGQAAVVVQAHPVDRPEAHTTQRNIGQGQKLVHFVQRLHVIEKLKGAAPVEVKLIIPGVDPLTPAKYPHSPELPGPLAEDEAYVLFLKPAPLTGYYTAIGGWQGIYPISDEARTIALEGSGFPSFGGLSVAELKEYLGLLSDR